MRDFAKGSFGELHLTECSQALRASVDKVQAGDLSAAESMLMTQAVALNAIFGELARRSALNMGEYLDASERCMRLALKAQGQARATLETLAAIKNPPVVFARQANINNGGQQQVNNGPAPEREPVRAGAHAEIVAGPQAGGVQRLPAPVAGTALDPTRGLFSPSIENNQSAT